MYDIVIIGAGMAGLTAAIYARRAGKSVLLLEKKVCGGQIMDSLEVENWPGEKSISGADLMRKVQKQAEDLGTEIRYEEVLGVVGDGHGRVPTELLRAESPKEDAVGGKCPTGPATANFVVKTDEGEYTAKAVIIATGTEPRKLGQKQMREAGKRPISYCATCDGALYKDKPVVVVGSGNTAKYEVKYLENIASKVYQIHHDDPIPKEAEAVFVATKRVPVTGLFKDLVDLDNDGSIIAGEDCRTLAPGIFVAGDCRTKRTRQLVTAAGDGATAAGAAIDFLA